MSAHEQEHWEIHIANLVEKHRKMGDAGEDAQGPNCNADQLVRRIYENTTAEERGQQRSRLGYHQFMDVADLLSESPELSLDRGIQRQRGA